MEPLPILIRRSSLSGHDDPRTNEVVQKFSALSSRLGLAVRPTPLDDEDGSPSPPNRGSFLRNAAGGGLCFLLLTGGTEARTLRDVNESGTRSVGLIAHPESNSLPAALEVAAYLAQMGLGVRLVQLSKSALEGGEGDTNDVGDFVGMIKAFQARRALRGLRLGVIGEPSPWLLTSQNLDDELIRHEWGVELVRIDLEGLRREIEGVTIEESQTIADEIIQNADHRPTFDLEEATDALADCGSCGASCRCCGAHGVIPEHVIKAARVFKALEVILGQSRLKAFTLRCFDLLERPIIAGCLAVSLMNDRGVVAGCEGDINAAVTMLLARAFVPEWSPFLANPVEVNATTGTVLLCHCTVARSICTSYSLDSHFESRLSVSISGKVKADGPVTVARVDLQRKLVFTAEGSIDVNYKNQTNQCRTQVQVQLDPADARALLENPLGNHHILVMGECAAAFKSYASLFLCSNRA